MDARPNGSSQSMVAKSSESARPVERSTTSRATWGSRAGARSRSWARASHHSGASRSARRLSCWPSFTKVPPMSSRMRTPRCARTFTPRWPRRLSHATPTIQAMAAPVQANARASTRIREARGTSRLLNRWMGAGWGASASLHTSTPSRTAARPSGPRAFMPSLAVGGPRRAGARTRGARAGARRRLRTTRRRGPASRGRRSTGPTPTG